MSLIKQPVTKISNPIRRAIAAASQRRQDTAGLRRLEKSFMPYVDKNAPDMKPEFKRLFADANRLVADEGQKFRAASSKADESIQRTFRRVLEADAAATRRLERRVQPLVDKYAPNRSSEVRQVFANADARRDQLSKGTVGFDFRKAAPFAGMSAAAAGLYMLANGEPHFLASDDW